MRKFLLLYLFLCCSCLGGLARKPIVKHPDSSVLIIEVGKDFWGNPRVKVASYRKLTNKMIVLGWVDLTKFEGWTLTKYDWEKKIKQRGNK